MDDNPEKLKETLDGQPFGGLVSPKQVSRGILALLDPESDYNGEILEVANRQPVSGKQILTIAGISYIMSSTPPPPRPTS